MRRTGLLLAVPLLTGCGGGGYGAEPSGPTGPTGPSGSPNSAVVSMRGDADIYGETTFSFSPLAVSIARNGTVTWSNGTGTVHNVTFVATAGAPANIGDHAGGTTVRTFTTAGTFNYNCTQHAGMSGQVIVQ